MKKYPENWEELIDVKTKMFRVSIEVQTEVIVLAKDSIDAEREAKYEIDNIIDDVYVGATEIKGHKDVPSFCLDDIPLGSINKLTCGEILDMKEELQSRREAWEEMDKKQIKFSFFDENIT